MFSYLSLHSLWVFLIHLIFRTFTLRHVAQLIAVYPEGFQLKWIKQQVSHSVKEKHLLCMSDMRVQSQLMKCLGRPKVGSSESAFFMSRHSTKWSVFMCGKVHECSQFCEWETENALGGGMPCITSPVELHKRKQEFSQKLLERVRAVHEVSVCECTYENKNERSEPMGAN